MLKLTLGFWERTRKCCGIMAGWDAGSGNSQCIKNPIFISYNLSAKKLKKKSTLRVRPWRNGLLVQTSTKGIQNSLDSRRRGFRFDCGRNRYLRSISWYAHCINNQEQKFCLRYSVSASLLWTQGGMLLISGWPSSRWQTIQGFFERGTTSGDQSLHKWVSEQAH